MNDKMKALVTYGAGDYKLEEISICVNFWE